jgi:adenine-specific DNA-methyltransferase
MTICEIGKERIRRAGKKIKGEVGWLAQTLDIGFRVLKVDSTNMRDVYYTPSTYQQDLLNSLADNIKSDRTAEDLLFQVMLDLGILFSSPIKEITFGGKKVYNVAEGYLLACFDGDINDDTVMEIARQKPYYAIFRDSSMASDSVAANFEQIFATYSPTTVRKVI